MSWSICKSTGTQIFKLVISILLFTLLSAYILSADPQNIFKDEEKACFIVADREYCQYKKVLQKKKLYDLKTQEYSYEFLDEWERMKEQEEKSTFYFYPKVPLWVRLRCILGAQIYYYNDYEDDALYYHVTEWFGSTVRILSCSDAKTLTEKIIFCGIDSVYKDMHKYDYKKDKEIFELVTDMDEGLIKWKKESTSEWYIRFITLIQLVAVITPYALNKVQRFVGSISTVLVSEEKNRNKLVKIYKWYIPIFMHIICVFYDLIPFITFSYMMFWSHQIGSKIWCFLMFTVFVCIRVFLTQDIVKFIPIHNVNMNPFVSNVKSIQSRELTYIIPELPLISRVSITHMYNNLCHGRGDMIKGISFLMNYALYYIHEFDTLLYQDVGFNTGDFENLNQSQNRIEVSRNIIATVPNMELVVAQRAHVDLVNQMSHKNIFSNNDMNQMLATYLQCVVAYHQMHVHGGNIDREQYNITDTFFPVIENYKRIICNDIVIYNPVENKLCETATYHKEDVIIFVVVNNVCKGLYSVTHATVYTLDDWLLVIGEKRVDTIPVDQDISHIIEREYLNRVNEVNMVEKNKVEEHSRSHVLSRMMHQTINEYICKDTFSRVLDVGTNYCGKKLGAGIVYNLANVEGKDSSRIRSYQSRINYYMSQNLKTRLMTYFGDITQMNLSLCNIDTAYLHNCTYNIDLVDYAQVHIRSGFKRTITNTQCPTHVLHSRSGYDLDNQMFWDFEPSVLPLSSNLSVSQYYTVAHTENEVFKHNTAIMSDWFTTGAFSFIDNDGEKKWYKSRVVRQMFGYTTLEWSKVINVGAEDDIIANNVNYRQIIHIKQHKNMKILTLMSRDMDSCMRNVSTTYMRSKNAVDKRNEEELSSIIGDLTCPYIRVSLAEPEKVSELVFDSDQQQNIMFENCDVPYLVKSKLETNYICEDDDEMFGLHIHHEVSSSINMYAMLKEIATSISDNGIVEAYMKEDCITYINKQMRMYKQIVINFKSLELIINSNKCSSSQVLSIDYVTRSEDQEYQKMRVTNAEDAVESILMQILNDECITSKAADQLQLIINDATTTIDLDLVVSKKTTFEDNTYRDEVGNEVNSTKNVDINSLIDIDVTEQTENQERTNNTGENTLRSTVDDNENEVTKRIIRERKCDSFIHEGEQESGDTSHNSPSSSSDSNDGDINSDDNKIDAQQDENQYNEGHQVADIPVEHEEDDENPIRVQNRYNVTKSIRHKTRNTNTTTQSNDNKITKTKGRRNARKTKQQTRQVLKLSTFTEAKERSEYDVNITSINEYTANEIDIARKTGKLRKQPKAYVIIDIVKRKKYYNNLNVIDNAGHVQYQHNIQVYTSYAHCEGGNRTMINAQNVTFAQIQPLFIFKKGNNLLRVEYDTYLRKYADLGARHYNQVYTKEELF